MSKLLIIFITCLLAANCLEENIKNEIELEVSPYLFEEQVGKIGTLAFYFYTLETSFDKDISRKTLFNATITSENNNEFKIKCGFWQAEERDLYIFCNLDEKIPAGKYSINLDNISGINFQNNIITLKQSEPSEFEKLDVNIPDLYSDKQTIEVIEGKDTYELKFKIVSYNKEKIILADALILDCQVDNSDIICHVTKKDLEKISETNVTDMRVTTINYYFYQKSLAFVPYVTVIYKNVKKENIYVYITKLIENMASPIAYETNVTEISDVFTLYEFPLSFINEDGTDFDSKCYFRKYEKTPLLIVCNVFEEGKIRLKEITEEIPLENINARYTFRIQPVNSKDIIYYKDQDGSGSFVDWVYPEVLDFRKNDNLILEYDIKYPKNLIGITLNEEANDLNCEIFRNRIKRCTVPKSHFKDKKNGYYFTKFHNFNNTKSVAYEIPPIKVILPDDSHDSGNFINLEYYFNLALLILIMV